MSSQTTQLHKQLHRTQWSKSVRNEVVTRYKNGEAPKSLAQEYGVPIDHIYVWKFRTEQPIGLKARETGCKEWHDCLTCPLAKCIYDKEEK